MQQLVAARLLNSESVEVEGALLTAVTEWPSHLLKVMEAGVIHSVAFSRDGTRIASGGLDGTVTLWDAKNGRQMGQPLTGPKGPVWSIAFGRDSAVASGRRRRRRVAVGVESGQSRRPADRQTHRRRDPDGIPVYSVAFSADGARIVAGGAEGRVRLWDTTSRDRTALIRTIPGISHVLQAVAFNPDASIVASVGGDGALRIWDASNKPIVLASKGVDSVAFSPDGSRIVSGDDDGTMRLWDARTHKVLGALEATRAR